MADYDQDPWLPIVMPRPQIFGSRPALPDLDEPGAPGLIELGRTRTGSFETMAVVEEQAGEVPRLRRRPPPARRIWEVGDNFAATLLTSLPIFTGGHLFDGGALNDGLQLGMRHGLDLAGHVLDDFRVIITRSLITWSSSGLWRAPLYRSDRMTWGQSVPAPDFSSWPAGIPAQVVVPFERPWRSAHRRMQIAAGFDDDLALLSRARGWGAHEAPLWLKMPREMPRS